MDTNPNRERLMLAGLFLSRFSRTGLSSLGFSSFSEAYNSMGYALGGKPTSIKNYRQEFDPYLPNPRKGWHKRELRSHCREVLGKFGNLSLGEFSSLISSWLSETSRSLPDGLEEIAALEEEGFENKTFSNRLITGIAAERFFEQSFPKLSEFEGCTLGNVTRFGCGFDFRVQPPERNPFIAVEVKGIAGDKGEIMMTSKEHFVAEHLRDRYYVCVVSNFKKHPKITLFRNPLNSALEFCCKEELRCVRTWNAKVAI